MSNRPDDLDVLAGEFVLGLMNDADRDAFAQRLERDPAARAAVALAQERFLELDTSAPAAPDTERLWQRIETGLADRSGTVVDLEARRRQAASRAAAPARLVQSRGAFWRGFAAASVIAAIAAGAAWNLLAPPAPRMIVVLLDSDAKPVSIVETYAGQRVRIVPLDRIQVPENRTLQVWTLPDPATGPVSIGLIPPTGATTLDGPSLPAPKVDQLYEITLEPAGGSPTGRPTGPIIGKGFAKSPQI